MQPPPKQTNKKQTNEKTTWMGSRCVQGKMELALGKLIFERLIIIMSPRLLLVLSFNIHHLCLQSCV